MTTRMKGKTTTIHMPAVKKALKIIAVVSAMFFSAGGCAMASPEQKSVTELTETAVPSDRPEETAQPTIASVEPSETFQTETLVKKSEAELILEGMTLEEKIGQMFYLAFRQDASGKSVIAVNDSIVQAIGEKNIGGVILFSENIVSEAQVTKLIADMKELAVIPLFVGIDEEGGSVLRTKSLGYAKVPSAEAIGKAGIQTAFGYGQTIAGYLKPLGFNMDFAPVADINTNPNNTVIGSRAFGKDAETVADMAVSFMLGLRDGGLLAAVKHYPGHGDTNQDSHKGFASVNHDLQRLREVELVPFKAASDNGVGFVMAGHVSVPAVTGSDEPSIFSEYMLKDILREELGFDGITITDAMDMGAVTKYYSADEAAVKCIKAGIDMILMPENFEKAYNAVLVAVENGEISEEAINEAVLRILKAKLAMAG